jgi:hypothetical protein
MKKIEILTVQQQRALEFMMPIAAIGAICAFLLAASDFVGWSFWQVSELDPIVKEEFFDELLKYILVVGGITTVAGLFSILFSAAAEQESSEGQQRRPTADSQD